MNLVSDSPQRLFIIGGIFLILAGMIFGEVFAVFILHPSIANIDQALQAAAQAAMAQDTEGVYTHMRDLGMYLEYKGTKVDAHSHIIQFGYLALLLALIQPYIALSETIKLRLGQLYLFGAIVLPPSVFLIHYVGLNYSPLETIGWASIVADTGGLIIIIVCVCELFGLFKYFTNTDNQSEEKTDLLQEYRWESRVLLASGSLLLLVGFLFGAWYAAFKLDPHETSEVAILQEVMAESINKNRQNVAQALNQYGLHQAEKGVSIAAHAHINEFGMLALLLAFIQPYIFLSQKWHRRWIKVMVAASVVLPVSVLLELKFGLLAMILADVGGLFIIVSLFGMFVGVLRHTGKVDAGFGAAT